MHRLLHTLAAGLLASSLALPLQAQQEKDRFVPVRIQDASGEVPADVRRGALRGLAAQEPDPQHIVTLIHGFDTPTHQSDEEYDRIAAEIRREFRARGERVAVLGVQWPSDAGALRNWLPKSVAHYTLKAIGFKKAVKDPYQQRVLMANNIGARAVRSLLLDVRAEYPTARLHIFAHSLGSEVALHAVDPLSDPDEHAADLTYQPDQKLNVDLVSLAGADLDQDHRLPVFGTGAGSIQLLWITVPERGATRDRVLVLRKLTRGKPAVGDGAPRFSAKDLDDLVASRRLVFDSRDIPAGHALTDYYEAERIRRLADAAVALRTGEPGRSELLGELDRLLKEPVQSKRLRSALQSEDASQRLYALWRLEHAYCGAATHLVDGSAQKLATLALRNPQDAEKLRAKSSCVAFKNGYSLVPPLASSGQ